MSQSCPEHLGRALVGMVVALAVLVAAPASARAPVAVAGEGPFEVSLTTAPGRIVLGRVGRVALRIRAPDPEGPLRPLRASVNVGTLGEVERVGEGLYEVIYRPPKARYPQLAVVAVWRETGPTGPVAFFRVPLLGTAVLPYATSPGASVTATVAGERFGPFEADAQGQATVRLVVPPGVPEAKVVATGADGLQTVRIEPLEVPPYNRLTLAVVPHAIVADGVDQAGLYLYYDATGRRTPRAGRVRVDAPVGRLAAMRDLPGPVFGTTFRAPAGLPDQTVAFSARVAGDRASGARASVSLGRQVPEQVVVRPRVASALAGPGTTVQVEAAVLDALGLGVAGARPELTAAPLDAGVLGPPRRERQGVWVWPFTPAVRDPREGILSVTFTAVAEGREGEGELTLRPRQPDRLELVAAGTGDPLPADGEAGTRLRVRVYDAEGVALPGLRPEVRARLGRVDWAPDGDLVYRAPRLEVLVDRGEPLLAPPRPDAVVASLGAARAEATVSLLPVVDVRPERGGFAEVATGWHGGRSGPGLEVALGARLIHFGPWSLSLGAGTGVDGLAGDAPEGSPARLQAVAVPVFAQLRGAWRPGDLWELGGLVEAGAVSVVGEWSLPGGGQVPFGAWAPSYGAGLWAAPRVGPGRLVMRVGARAAHLGPAGNQAWEVGSVGGPAAMIGYRLEL